MCETAENKTYSLVTDPQQGTTGTGFDQLVSNVFLDPGLAGANDGKEIQVGAATANQLNQMIIEAAQAVGADADKVFTVDEVVRMNAYIRADAARLQKWTDLHGDDENDAETGYHLVQNDGSNVKYRGDNLLDTVEDGIYHMGFEICNGRFLNEDGNENATVQDVADWLTQFFTDRSTTGTGLDRVTDLVMADGGLDCKIPDRDIAAGADAADDMNHMLTDAIAATGVMGDGRISEQDVVALNTWLRADPARAEQWNQLHGDDEKDSETGFHLVQNDGASATYFGQNFVNTVADGIYHLGYEIKNGRVLNEDGNANAKVSDLADWLNYFMADQSTTGTGLDHIVDWIKEDRGLAHCTSAKDIVAGLDYADQLNHEIVDLIARTGAAADRWITVDEVAAMNTLIRSDAAALEEWTALHGDDEGSVETGYHLIQNDGANTDFMAENLADTVADGIYHMGFEICNGRFLNEDGNPNVAVADVATWLNLFYNEATIVNGDGGANALTGDERGEQINAGSGNDRVNAGTGDDLIYGGAGNDILAGEDGGDLVYGGSGNDQVSGGAGDDVFRVTGGLRKGFEGYDTYDGGAGSDSIVAYGDKVDIGMSSFVVGNGIEVIDVTAATNGARIVGDWRDNSLDFSAVEVRGNLSIETGGGKDNVVGTAGADTIVGGHGNDQLSGGGGNDLITGGGGRDVLIGGEGNDTFRVAGTGSKYFEGFDSYNGGNGQDVITAVGASVDLGLSEFSATNGIEQIDFTGVTGKGRILGDAADNSFDFSAVTIVGNASIDAGGGNDTLIGSSGNDIMLGSWGNDRLTGGAGNDQLTGGSGADTFAFGAGWGSDTVTDFRRGVDKLDLRDAGVNDLAALSITQAGGNTVIAFDGDQVVLQNVQTSTLTANDFIFA
ncbi:MAG: calcium-binding protein [Rhodocyclales bacterium]|nr:calcium-binding protein [Rhodocyclales bacterium]